MGYKEFNKQYKVKQTRVSATSLLLLFSDFDSLARLNEFVKSKATTEKKEEERETQTI